MIAEVAAFVLLAISAWHPDLRAALRATWPAVIAVGGLAAVGLAQSVAWPASVVRFLSPMHATLQAQVASVAGAPAAATLSLAPGASRAAALTFAAAAAVLVCAATTGARRRFIVLVAPLAGAFVQLVYGARALFSHSNAIWGTEVTPSGNRLRGTFVDSDHAAVYFEMGLAIVFAWGWLAARRRGALPRRETIVAWIREVAPPLLCWLTLFVGLAFTGSRAGLVAAIAGVVAQGVLVAVERRRVLPGTAGGLLAVLGVAVVASVSVEQGLGRFMTSASTEAPWDQLRSRAYALSFELWGTFPWLGTGLATFRDAFPLVQTSDLPGSWWHAHSDYLEILVTTGVVGATILGAGGLWLMTRLIGELRRRGRLEDQAVVLAALGALAAVGLHETVDFGLAMPANALTLAAICGVALAPVAPRHG